MGLQKTTALVQNEIYNYWIEHRKIQGPQRMNPIDPDDLLTLNLTVSSSWK